MRSSSVPEEVAAGVGNNKTADGKDGENTDPDAAGGYNAQGGGTTCAAAGSGDTKEDAAAGGGTKEAAAEEAAAPGGEKKDATAKEAAAESATEEEAADAAAGAVAAETVESQKKDAATNAGDALACLMCTVVLNDGQPVTALECGHTFHVDCIGRWAAKSGGEISMRICPFKCKFATLDVDDDDVQTALAQALETGDDP
jgi:hypothetical protein